ncbi:hypothetical protein CCH79_00009843, partial [Gambusia affinis]
MEDWAISNKVKRFVTDAAPNMIASIRQLQIWHSICIEHSFNLLVRKSCDQIPTITSTRHIVTCLRLKRYSQGEGCSSAATDGTTDPETHELPTRWNRTKETLSRPHGEREPVRERLASPKTDLSPLTADDYVIIGGTLPVLAPFRRATVELSEERRATGSKVIMSEMLQPCTHRQPYTNMSTDAAPSLESLSVSTIATLPDPRCKPLGFSSSSKCRRHNSCLHPQHLDMEVGRQTKSVTADVIQEVQRYLAGIPYVHVVKRLKEILVQTKRPDLSSHLEVISVRFQTNSDRRPTHALTRFSSNGRVGNGIFKGHEQVNTWRDTVIHRTQTRIPCQTKTQLKLKYYGEQ